MWKALEGKPRLVSRSLLLMLFSAFLVFPATASQAQAVAPSSAVAASAGQELVPSTMQQRPQRDYARGYRDGYREGRRDSRKDCAARHDDNRRHRDRQGEYDRGYADGYSKASETYCRPGTV
jgi:hypothetical protein